MIGAVAIFLLNIPTHQELGENDDRVLFTFCDIQSSQAKLNRMLKNWKGISDDIYAYNDEFWGKCLIQAGQGLFSASRILIKTIKK